MPRNNQRTDVSRQELQRLEARLTSLAGKAARQTGDSDELPADAVDTVNIANNAVTRSKLAVDINDSVLLEHVTNTGSVTGVALRHGNQTLGENEVGIPVDRPRKTNSAVVVWRADNAPTGNWTLTLKKKVAGSRTYTTAATLSVTVNNG